MNAYNNDTNNDINEDDPFDKIDTKEATPNNLEVY